jgi:glycosyltransferase involved in cell wall biosynthesis
MHVVLTADPELLVPPRHYGGIERIIAFLARGLVARGHHVTLFAKRGSAVDCEVIAWRGQSSLSRADTLRNMWQLTRHLRSNASQRDLIVHSFARLAYLMPALAAPVPKIQSYQRYVTPRSVRAGAALSRSSLSFTACSASCARTAGGAGQWQVIYNGVELERYVYKPVVPPDAPLVFLGRVERIKGAHHAIAIAQRCGRRLLIAGNRPDSGPEAEYCDTQVLARCDGERIRYVGPVDDAQKNTLLGEAAALLFPIEWEEPFGIVMAEALACGTPVIALRRGSVPEVVADGESGFVCHSVDEMVQAVDALPSLDRRACRRVAEQRFSSDIIVSQYEALYRERLTQPRR